MIETITSYIAQTFKKRPSRIGIETASRSAEKPPAEEPDRQQTYARVFRWQTSSEKAPPPTLVEVVGSFSDWQKVPLAYDSVTKSWQTTLQGIEGNRTHRYVMLVDGKPVCDPACDGLTIPQNPQEAQWQIDTPKGPRVMLLFGQTK